MTTPPRPEQFSPKIPPPGVTRNLVSFNDVRVKITPRLILVHTNGASKEGNVASAKRWAESNPGTNTCPHFQVDRDGTAGMLLELDRKGIGNYKVAGWSWVIETADTGYLDDPTISAFTDKQAETVAVILAYGHMLYKIPLEYPATWDGAGTACHTEPFGYPVWTNSNGKICPGLKKKRQVRDVILPRAQEIVAAWTAPTPPPPPPIPPVTNPTGARMGAPLVLRFGGTPTSNWSGYFSFDGITRQGVRGMHHAAQLVALGAIDAKTGKPVVNANWSDVTHTTMAEELDEWLTPGAD